MSFYDLYIMHISIFFFLSFYLDPSVPLFFVYFLILLLAVTTSFPWRENNKQFTNLLQFILKICGTPLTMALKYRKVTWFPTAGLNSGTSSLFTKCFGAMYNTLKLYCKFLVYSTRSYAASGSPQFSG